MKKSLLALAVLGAFAGAASAQTNVQIYGVVDAGIQRTNTDLVNATTGAVSDADTWALESGLQNGSRLGFKGSEDLGGGLSAIFTLENGFSTDTGNLGQGGRLFGRQAFVGLEGGFGAVKLGRQNTPLHLALDSIDPFGTNLAGNLENVFNDAGQRTDNTINYSLPNLGNGLYGQIAYTFGEQAGDTSGNQQIGLSIGYANGPINVVLAHHRANNQADTATGHTTMLGGTYDFRVAKVHAAFADNQGDFKAGALIAGFTAGLTSAQITAASNASGFDEDIETRDFMLGVSAPVSAAGTVLASWARKDDRNSDLKYDQFAIGYTHSLSKRTGLYTSFGYGKAESGGDDLKKNVFNVGVRHKF